MYQEDTRKAHNKQTILNLHQTRFKSRRTKKTTQNPKKRATNWIKRATNKHETRHTKLCQDVGTSYPKS
jgi:hypothetical protein